MDTLKQKAVSPEVRALGWVSFFTDISSEMIYPLLPVFLSGVLGAGTVVLGLIEGVGETSAALTKMLSGLWTDRTPRRKPLIWIGYVMSSIAKPCIGFATSWTSVLLMRFFDRVGKGVRTAPRDALIADISHKEGRGAAYGFHRAMDHAGAVLGPVLASLLFLIPGMTLKIVFFLTVIPGALAVLVLSFGVKDRVRKVVAQEQSPLMIRDWKKLGPDFKWLLLALFIFTLGNSTDAFLLIRLAEVGIPVGTVALIWSLHNGVKMVSTYYGGRWADRLGRRPMIVLGWAVFAMTYWSFAVFSGREALIFTFLFYGLYYGLVEPAERAWIADLAAPSARGAAFGFYHFTIGVGALPASLAFGLVWKMYGSFVAFMLGAVLAMTASLLLFVVKRTPNRAKTPMPEAGVES